MEIEQLTLFCLCDCCGEPYGAGLRGGHKACGRAWNVWLRNDNHADWRNMVAHQDAARLRARRA
jgi:hypothetical protein